LIKSQLISELFRQLKATYPSRGKSEKFAKRLLGKPEKIEELMKYFFSEDLRICQMASFPIITIANHDIESLSPYLEKMIASYYSAPHDAFRRNVVRTLQLVDIPEYLEGEAYDLCFKEFCNTKAPTAMRVFATTTLVNICIKHPELKEELLPTLIDYQNTGTIGFENRLQKSIKKVSAIKDVS